MDVPESSHVNDDETDAFWNIVSRIIFQRLEVSLTIVVKDKFVFDIIDSTHGSLALKAYQQNLYLKYYY